MHAATRESVSCSPPFLPSTASGGICDAASDALTSGRRSQLVHANPRVAEQSGPKVPPDMLLLSLFVLNPSLAPRRSAAPQHLPPRWVFMPTETFFAAAVLVCLGLFYKVRCGSPVVLTLLKSLSAHTAALCMTRQDLTCRVLSHTPSRHFRNCSRCAHKASFHLADGQAGTAEGYSSSVDLLSARLSVSLNGRCKH